MQGRKATKVQNYANTLKPLPTRVNQHTTLPTQVNHSPHESITQHSLHEWNPPHTSQTLPTLVNHSPHESISTRHSPHESVTPHTIQSAHNTHWVEALQLVSVRPPGLSMVHHGISQHAAHIHHQCPPHSGWSFHRSACLHCTCLHCKCLHCTCLNCTCLNCTCLHCMCLCSNCWLGPPSCFPACWDTGSHTHTCNKLSWFRNERSNTTSSQVDDVPLHTPLMERAILIRRIWAWSMVIDSSTLSMLVT